MGGILDGLGEVSANPLADEVIGDCNLEAVLLEIKPSGVIEPDMETLLSHALGDGGGQAFQLRIVCADTAHGDLLEVDQPVLLDRPPWAVRARKRGAAGLVLRIPRANQRAAATRAGTRGHRAVVAAEASCLRPFILEIASMRGVEKRKRRVVLPLSAPIRFVQFSWSALPIPEHMNWGENSGDKLC